MDDLRFRRLDPYRVSRSGSTTTFALPLPTSPNGMTYRACPNHSCTPRLFQIDEATGSRELADDERRLPRREPGSAGMTCPYCGHDGDDDVFVSPDDLQAIGKFAEWAMAEDIGEYLEEWAGDLNRSLGSGGFISMKVDVERDRRPRPVAVREDLLRDLACEVCARRYGVYAIGLFCPDCGAPNLATHFQRELELVRQQVELADTVGEQRGAEFAYRLLGNAHEDVVTALETYLKTAYRHLIRRDAPAEAPKLVTKKAIGNKFQNVDRGRQLFTRLSFDPYAILDEGGVEFVRFNIEKRHVIGHNLSVADDLYAETGGEEPGQTVTLLADQIVRFAEICGHVIGHVERDQLASPAA
jgi:hypothetical protein